MFVYNYHCGKVNSLRLYLSLALIATVASVPTSVMVQNSELASNAAAAAAAAQQNHQNSQHIFPGNSLNKVKRSSGLNKNEGQTSQKNSAEALMNKKSSPEIVPASYSAPPSRKSNIQAAMENNNNNINNNQQKNNDLISSAIAAGLTAAAVEAAAVAANQHELEQLRKQHQLRADDTDDQQSSSSIIKRGINPQHYGYGNMPVMQDTGYGNSPYSSLPSSAYYNPYGSFDSMTNMGSDVPQGVWSEDLDPANVMYPDIEDYAPVARVPSYRNKAYDNLQSILNSESYLEPAAPAPVPYNNGRFYNSVLDSERNKRAYKVFNQLASKFPDMRLKRDTKLTPADMLALVALVEAGERARKDTDTDAGYTMYPAENYVPKAYGINNNYNSGLYDYPSMGGPAGQFDDSLDYNNGAWYEQPAMVDYYGVPMNVEPMPKYEVAPRENKYNERLGLFNNKHYMVNKKKRSIAKPIVPYKQDNLF